MKVWIAGIALVGALASGVAQADGNSLLTQCQASVRFMNNDNDSTNDFGQGKCFGIVEAVIATTVIRNEQMPKESKVCFPSGGITNGQGIRIVVKYLQENPSLLHLSDTLLAMIAIGQAYPCE
ncbi:Rap1a/Tai family immunity protein [Pseudomonas sp. 18058]|uniref:Rap1a/Tai family immunity protein n=1 Tax=Pseudomonas sp. 18058 TaxID=2681406 RepID=UPI00135C7B92|nr:Rap1a/Tai family immunity protein [Pseudomonas sp. 18058]